MAISLVLRCVTACFLLEICISRFACGIITIPPEDREVMVGQPTYFNCSSSIYQLNIHWYFYSVGATGLERKYVYAFGKLYRPYDQKFRVENCSNGVCNLLIVSATLDDAGIYVCQDDGGIGDTKTAQLVVLATYPVCIGRTDPIVGPNSCGVEPDELSLSCSVAYSGNIPPVMEWKSSRSNESLAPHVITENAGNIITYNLTMKADLGMSGSIFFCETTKSVSSQYNCTIANISVQYVFNDSLSVNASVDNQIVCSANKSKDLGCHYKWKWYQSEHSIREWLNPTLQPTESGWYRCEATCNIKEQLCSIRVMDAYVFSSEKLENWKTIIIIVSVVALIALFLFIGIFIYVKKKQREKAERSRKDILESMELLQTIGQNEVRKEESLKRHKKYLVVRIDPDFGLLDKLLENASLSDTEFCSIKTEGKYGSRNAKLLEYILNKESCDFFIDALNETQQKHIVNFLTTNGQLKRDFGDDWPLTEKKMWILDANYKTLLDMLNTNDVVNRLSNLKSINEEHLHYISSKSTAPEKNEAFLDILKRCSMQIFKTTIYCLRDTNQNNVALVLEKGGLLIPMDVNLKVKEGDPKQKEQEIVAIFQALSQQERNSIFAELKNLGLTETIQSNSIRTYFHCLSLGEVDRLMKMAKNGQLKNIFQTIFNQLITDIISIQVQLDRLSEYYNRAKNFFKAIKEGNDSDEEISLYVPSTIDELPEVLLDIILQRCYFKLHQNRLIRLPHADVIINLASVNNGWYMKIKRGRFKRIIRRQLEVLFQSTGKRSAISRNVQQYLLENIQIKGLPKHLRSIDCLTDKETRTITRFGQDRKPRDWNKKSDLLHLMKLFNNARFYMFWNCLRNSQQKLPAKLASRGGAVVKSYIKMKLESSVRRNVIEDINKLRDSIKNRPELKKIYGDLEDRGVELLGSSLDKHIVLWMWCRTKTSLEKLQKVTESNGLREIFDNMCRVQVSKEPLRVPRKDNVEGDQATETVASAMQQEMLEDFVVIVGMSDDSGIADEVLKVNLHRPSDFQYLQKIPTTVHAEMATAVYRNNIYVVGLGENADQIWKYEKNSGWTECTSLNQGRRRHSIAFVNEVLYICGGVHCADMTVLDSVEEYDTGTKECKSTGNLFHPCESSGNCVVYNKSLYLFGGMDKDDETSSHVQIYDTEQNSCHLLSKPMPVGDFLMRAVLWQQKVILIGESNCFIYDFEKETWQLRENFNTNVTHFGLAVSSNRIYIFGGGYTSHGEDEWRCRGDIRSITIEKIIENKPAEWKIRGKLPAPCLVDAFGMIGGISDGPNSEREVGCNALAIPVVSQPAVESISIDGDQFRKTFGKIKFKEKPDLKKIIKTTNSRDLSSGIYGMCTLHGELFVITASCSDVEVFDSQTSFSFKRKMLLPNSIRPYDVTSCHKNKCLYISGTSHESKPGVAFIVRVDPEGNLIKQWKTVDHGRVSVAHIENVLLTLEDTNTIMEYGPNGIHLCKWELGIHHPLHVKPYFNGSYVVSHGGMRDKVFGVCLFDQSWNQIQSFPGKKPIKCEKLRIPIHMAIDRDGWFIIVSDLWNKRIVLLNRHFEFERELVSVEDGLQQPYRISFDEPQRRLFIADGLRNGRVFVFDLG